MQADRPTRSGPPGLPDWDQLRFSFVETDSLYIARGCSDHDPVWDDGEHREFGPLSLSPATAFFSYGLGIFEGQKARRTPDGRILLFRIGDNAQRFRRSAERLLLESFPADRFVQAAAEVVRRNRRFVPPHGKGAFYLRPLQHAVEPLIGLRPGREFSVMIFGIPVGSFFAGRDPSTGLKLKIIEQARCVPGGTGSAKAMGNYAGGIAIAEPFKREGFDDVLYLDACELRHVTETSGSNFFAFLADGTLVTPAPDDQILAGITRDSAIRIARERLGVEVVERPLPVEEVLEQGREIFCTGTAWTVCNVSELDYRGRRYRFPASDLQRSIRNELQQIQRGLADDPFGWTMEIPDEA